MTEKPTRYADLSDDEFRAELRRHMDDRSWTLDHMVELEHRGNQCLVPDPQLERAVEEENEYLRTRLAAAFSPAMERWQSTLKLSEVGKSLAEQIGADWTRNYLGRISPADLEIPSVETFAGFPAPPAGSIPMRAPAFDDIVESLGEDAARRAQEAEQAMLVQVEQLDVLRTMKSEVSQLNERDGWDKVTIGAALVAAFASVLAIIIALA
jgi:hypothetical protein